jgi:acetoin utilization protein AcuB
MMLINNWMRTNVITVDADASMQEAIGLIKKNRIRMLPVMENGKLVGVVSDRDLRKTSISETVTFDIPELLQKMSQIKVRDIMTKDPITVPHDYTVEETAALLLAKRISGVPVVDQEGRMVGIITQSDLFQVLMSATGMGKRGLEFEFMKKEGIQFGFLVEDRAGSIMEVADVIRKYGGRMRSILTSYDRVPEGYRKVYIRMYGIGRSKLAQMKEELREKANLLYMVDHRLNQREIYQQD